MKRPDQVLLASDFRLIVSDSNSSGLVFTYKRSARERSSECYSIAILSYHVTSSRVPIQSTLADRFDGEPTGRGTVEIVCDCPHELPCAVETDRRVQYECIRPGESLTMFEGSPIIGEWGLDILRCADCEVTALPEPTAGFGEALIRTALVQTAEGYVLETDDLAVLDHSPVDDGAELPSVPQSVRQSIDKRNDPGAFRRSRLRALLPHLRRKGGDELADTLEGRLDNHD